MSNSRFGAIETAAAQTTSIGSPTAISPGITTEQ
jgi:hypothetical protein